ncbi:hypothetical protein FQN54_001941 [Arachnomyces sp. PD_36]|nr:hypothetical protein FQN54_001941 [Arachnomyces sp. PD_36]
MTRPSDQPVYVRSNPSLPVARSPPFSYHGSRLFVDHFTRSPSADLLSLLTYKPPPPLLTKKGKPRVRQPPPHIDESPDFYAAQIIHYGLTSSGKGKEDDKAVLLAYGKESGGQFVVPERIREVERRLSDEWREKQREWEKEVEVLEKRRVEMRKGMEEREKRQALKRKRREEKELEDAFEGEYKVKKAKVGEAKPRISLDLLFGEYTIAAPSLENGWDCYQGLTLKLNLSSSGSHMWGSFDFAIFEGKLRSEKLDKDSFGGTIRFHWRGRETGEGESTFGKENVATFTFLDDGMFRGKMYWDCYGTFELVGKKNVKGAGNKAALAKEVRGWKDGYRELNEKNWDAECSNRWGGFQIYAKADKPAESDTSDGRGDDDDDDEDEDEYGYGM